MKGERCVRKRLMNDLQAQILAGDKTSGRWTVRSRLVVEAYKKLSLGPGRTFHFLPFTFHSSLTVPILSSGHLERLYSLGPTGLFHFAGVRLNWL